MTDDFSFSRKEVRASASPLRADREQILRQAVELALQYAMATGVGCVVLDEEGQVLQDKDLPAPQEGKPREQEYRQGEREADSGNRKGLCALCDSNQCRNLHLHAATQARRSGGSFVYLCPLGFMQWASPLFLAGRSLGVLVGGPVLAIDGDEALAGIYEIRPDLSQNQLHQALTQSTRADTNRIHALSQLMARLAEQVSSGGLEELEAGRRKTEQQSRISEEIHELKQRLVAGEESAVYPLEKERSLLAALRRGDETGSRRILNELLGTVFFSSSSKFELVKFRATELLILLSRAVIEFGRVDREIGRASCRERV